MEWKANSTGPSSETHRLARRAALVDLVSLLDREVDHHEALEGIGIAEVDERTVGQALVGAAEVEDAGGAGQAGDELAAAHVHGEQHVADGDAAAELLGVGQRLGDAMARERARRQLLRCTRHRRPRRAHGRG